MITDTVAKIRNLTSGERMLSRVRVLNDYDRYQASLGFREAALACAKFLQEDGIHAEILTYPATSFSFFESMQGPQFWSITDGWCEVVEEDGRRIADYKSHRSDVAERCGSVAESTYEVVVLDKGSDQSNYPDLDLNGKVALLYLAQPQGFEWAFGEGKAKGFICVPPVVENADHVARWVRVRDLFWKDIFGYVVSPKEGKHLLEVIEKLKAQGKAMHVNCFCDAKRHDDVFEVVSATLPGESQEEVLIVGHLCHPQNSCNDNISGCVAGMEAMRVLSRLIETKALAPLKRGIRLLLVPEMLGTLAYIQSNRDLLPLMVGGINLDMVGVSQNDHNGPMSLNETSHSLPSIVGALGTAILEELKKDDHTNSEFDYVPLFNSLVIEYRAGSDHDQFSDPLVNIPMPMLGQYPDRFYHTDGDVPETLDPFILEKSSGLAAAFAYTLANLGKADIPVLKLTLFQLLVLRLTQAANRVMTKENSPWQYEQQVDQYVEYYQDCFGSLARYFGESLAAVIEKGKADIAAMADLVRIRWPKAALVPESQSSDARMDKIPQRSYLGHLYTSSAWGSDSIAKVENAKQIVDAYKEKYPDDFKGYLPRAIMGFYIDGKRTVREIIRKAVNECHGHGVTEELLDYLDLLADLKIISYVS
ncbi:MAG: DUF4910 domain-containing protein [Erysipelotrichaceae bacterium]|jgi:aminopeptidase-like protein|nr:DUF4910 domain-containing protein [Erysipelotrichaceae bacterium]